MSLLARALVAFTLFAGAARADESPTRWEQLFFPFPIVGAPPQLEQQVQLFVNVFTGNRGGGAVPSAEVAYIATPHLGLVVSFPYQFGFDGQPFGTGDLQLLAQYLAAGSLAHDDLLSMGLELSFPTAQHDLGSGDLLWGPFAYFAQRLWHHLILELNFTALIPTLHDDIARQFLLTGMISVLVTPRRSRLPLYAQVEINSTTFAGGMAGVAETLFVAPEIFIGPIKGVRLAAGVFFNVHGDPTHERTYSVTAAFDIPNRFGY